MSPKKINEKQLLPQGFKWSSTESTTAFETARENMIETIGIYSKRIDDAKKINSNPNIIKNLEEKRANIARRLRDLDPNNSVVINAIRSKSVESIKNANTISM
jgi:hypothetical protein